MKRAGTQNMYFFRLAQQTDISEVQRSFPNPRYEELSGLCGVSKCGCISDPAWVTLDI